MQRLLIPLLAVALASAPGADLKIGVVDTAKAYQDFYKTKEADAALQKMAEKAKAELLERNDECMKLLEKRWGGMDKKRLTDADKAENQRLDSEIKALEKEIEEFRQQSKTELDQQNTQQRRALYAEIHQAVMSKAQSSSFDLVLDKANASMNSAPLFLSLREGALPDITADVLVELNKNAPEHLPR